MKLTNALTLNTVKAAITRTAAVALVAGAAFLATPAKANAQVGFGVHFGPVGIYHGPVYARHYGYYRPAPVVVGPAYGYGYYGPRFYGPRYEHPYWHGRRWYR